MLGSSPPQVQSKWYVPDAALVPVRPLTAIVTEETAMVLLAAHARARFGEGTVVRIAPASSAEGIGPGQKACFAQSSVRTRDSGFGM